jgi:hypothetical protein
MLGIDFKPDVIDPDEKGWYLVYEDSPAGLAKLTRCFKRFNNKLLFSEYKLSMQCYPNGKQPRSLQDIDVPDSGGPKCSSASQLLHERPDSPGIPRLTGFKQSQLTYPKPVENLESKIDAASPSPEKADTIVDHLSHALPDNLSNHASDLMSTNEVPPMGTSTSLLSLRSDRDETGSLGSGVTRSDGTRIKRDRCYRCNGESVPGSSILVRCSTCTRQYHKRCHQDFPIPTNLTETSAWSCASCVKKKERASKEILKEDSQKPPSKHEQVVSKANSVLDNAPDNSPSEMPDDRGPVVTNVDEVPIAQVQLLRSDSKSPQHDIQQQSVPTTNTKSSTGDEHAVLSDADDLVAKSFAAAEVQSRSRAQLQKSGKLKITRTKLQPKPPNMTAQQSQSENQPELNGSSKDSPATALSDTATSAASMNGAVGRGSASDLRALAHERHQTAIKNGAEGYFVSEEQRLRHNAPENTPRFTPARQSLGKIVEPQKPSSMVPRSSAPAIAKHVTERNEREIPESPDEVSCSEASSSKDPIVNPRKLALTRPTEIASAPLPQNNSDVIPTQDEKSATLMRPRAPSAVVRCQNCQKTIPKGPTGKNKLCSGCKRDAAAAIGSNVPVDARAVPLTSTAPLQTSFAPVANTGHSPQTVIAPPKLVAQSEKVIESDQKRNGLSKSAHGSGRVSCDTCCKHNTSCSHNDIFAQAPTALGYNQQGTGATASGTPTRDTTSGEVEKASLAQDAEHPAPIRDFVHNPLAAKILGELQFAPTVQIQLREEPSMAESKIVLLKQVLDENDDAKTDVLILATKLAEARKLSFIKSVVGDSGDRPMGARLILVAMALGSTCSRRMQAPGIKEWIASTIPGYKRREGNWESRISAELSQEKLSPSGSGYWREEEWQVGEGGKPKCKWYRLLPEKEDEMWTWCPVLKEPLSPSARREAQKTTKSAVKLATAAVRTITAASTSGLATPKSGTNGPVSIYCGSFVPGEDGKLHNTNSEEAAGDDAMDIDELMGNESPEPLRGLKRKHPSRSKMTESFTPDQKDYSSSEDEPLSASWKIKRRRGGTLLQARTQSPATQQQTPTNRRSQDEMKLEPGVSTVDSAERGEDAHDDPDGASKSSGTSAGRGKAGLVILHLNGSRRPSTADYYNHYFAAKRVQLASSLYNEWPEFRQHGSDEHDKLAEIQKRPRKKQLFGKLASHPQVRFETDLSAQTFATNNFSPEKRSRTRMVDPRPDEPYPWENPDNDPTRKEYTSLEEFFDFPDNMIPIISEGQLAYRDGTRTDDGRLPRAREIFKL